MGYKPSWSNGKQCDSCGAWCQDDCRLCAAPQCCPQCCKISCLESKSDSDRELIEKLVEALEYSCDHSMLHCDGTCEKEIRMKAVEFAQERLK